jgi:hypothetical protein
LAHEIVQETRPGGAAFFRVKLRGENISVFEDSGEVCTVIASGNDFLRGSGSRESVREIEVVGFAETRE